MGLPQKLVKESLMEVHDGLTGALLGRGHLTGNQEEQLKVYPRSRKDTSQPKSAEDLLNEENKKVLIVGRPGIGKTDHHIGMQQWRSIMVLLAPSSCYFCFVSTQYTGQEIYLIPAVVNLHVSSNLIR